MAELFKDGFDTSNPLTLKWDSKTGFGFVTGVFGTGKGVSQGVATKTLPGNYVTLIQSVHFNTGDLTATVIFEWRDAGSAQCDLRMDGTGALFFTRNGTTIGSVA